MPDIKDKLIEIDKIDDNEFFISYKNIIIGFYKIENSYLNPIIYLYEVEND